MSLTTILVAAGALLIGLAGGFFLARARRPPQTFTPYEAYEDETRPTLVPVKGERPSGRNLAKLTPHGPDGGSRSSG